MTPHLIQEEDFFVDVKFDRNTRGPEILEIKEKKFFRFMDFFYLPVRPHELSVQQVIALCDLRIKYFGQVVDVDVNRAVVECMASFAKAKLNKLPPIRALDFGCGQGTSLELINAQFDDIQLYGVDLSEKAVSVASRRFREVFLLKNGSLLPFDSQYFDVVFAVFVFHFSVEDCWLLDLWRVLKNGGLLIYNTYPTEPPLLRRTLSEAGFSEVVLVEGCGLSKKVNVFACFKPND